MTLAKRDCKLPDKQNSNAERTGCKKQPWHWACQAMAAAAQDQVAKGLGNRHVHDAVCMAGASAINNWVARGSLATAAGCVAALGCERLALNSN